MKIETEDHEHPKLLKNSQRQYELIGDTEKDVEAAKQWAEFWGREIVCRPRCRRLIPPVFKYQRATLLYL